MTQFENLNAVLRNLPVVRGVSPVDFLNMPDILGRTLGEMIQKQGMNLAEFSEKIGVSETEALQVAEILVTKGYLVEKEQPETHTPCYRVFFARMRQHHLPIDL